MNTLRRRPCAQISKTGRLSCWRAPHGIFRRFNPAVWLLGAAVLGSTAAPLSIPAASGADAPAAIPSPTYKDAAEEGRALMAQGKFADAAAKLRQFIQKEALDDRANNDASHLRGPAGAASRAARLDLAQALAACGLTLQATETYADILRIFPDDKGAPEVRYLRARSYEAQGKFAEAVDAYSQYLAQPNGAPADRLRDLRYHVAEIFDLVMQQPRDAVREYDKFAQDFPKDPRRADAEYRAAALMEGRLRDAQSAADRYARFVKDYPQDHRAPAAQAALCSLCEDRGLRDYPRAVQEYRNLLKLFPARPGAQGCWARIAFLYRDRLSQYANACDAYDAALQLGRTEALVWDRQEALWRAGKPDATLTALQGYLHEFPAGASQREARRRVAAVLNQMNQKDEAIKALEAIIREFPSSCIVEQWELASRYREKNDWPKVVEHLSALVQSNSGYGGRERYFRLADAAVQSKIPALVDAAEKTLLEALPKAQNEPEHYCAIQWALGQYIYLAQRKDYARAMACFRAMLDAAPFDDWSGVGFAQDGMVRAAREQQNLSSAIAAFRAFHKKHPQSWNARSACAMAAQLLLESGRDGQGRDSSRGPAAALAEAEQVVDPALDDDASVDATLTAAECYRRSGDEMKMLAQYAATAAARIEPWHSRLHARIDTARTQVIKPLLARLGGDEKPKVPAPALAPDDRLKRAMALHGMGQFATALEDYDAVLKSGALQGDPALQVQALRDDADRLSRFAAIYDGGELDKLPTLSLFRRGMDYINQRRFAEANNAWRLCVKRSPLHIPARLQIAQQGFNYGAYAAAGPEYLQLLKDVPGLSDDYRCQVAYTWYYNWKDARQTDAVRRMLEDAADRRPAPATLQWAIDVCQQRDPRDLRRALKYAQAYANLKSYDSDPWSALDRRIENQVQMKQFARAADLGLAWLKDNPQDPRVPDMLYRVGEVYRAATTLNDQAVKTFQELVEKYPTHPAAAEATWRVCDNLGAPQGTAMLEKLLKENPKTWANAAPALWRLAQRLPPAETARRLAILQEIWTRYRASYPENLYASCALLNACVAQKDGRAGAPEQNDAALKIAGEMADQFPGNQAGEVAAAWDLVMRHELNVTKDAAAFEKCAREMAAQFVGTRDVLRPLQLLREERLRLGDGLGAAIALQWAAAALPRGDAGSFDEVLRIAQSLADSARYEEAAALVHTAMKFSRVQDAERVSAAEKFMSACLSQSSGGLAVIDPSLVQAGLLMGDVFARAGEDNMAWQKFVENRKIFDRFRNDLSPAYVLLIARRLAESGEREAAVELCRNFIMQRQNDKRVADTDRAAIQLVLGDCYFHEQRFDIARTEYNSCANLYPRTPQAVQARFKVGECFMAQKIYPKAEDVFTELAKSKDEDTAIRAMLMQGFLFHAEGKQQETLDQFKKVLAMNPRNDVADELFFRMGAVYQETGKLREAYNLFRLVGSGGRETKRVVSPGTQLLFRLSDKDLNIARGEVKVPVLVETSSGDKETVYLSVSEAGSGLFVGEIATALGPIAPDDHVLQLRGNDTVTYHYRPDFAKDFLLEEKAGEDRTIRVASDADLEVSATEIKDDADEETAVRRAIAGWTAPASEARREYRRANEIKPGNNLYVRVTDKDCDLSDAADTVTVDVAAGSGDSLKLKLAETGPHTGIFRGTVRTGIRPPDASASDFSEGHEPLCAIDGAPQADKAWEGRHDGRMPKWLAVDLKEAYPVTRVTWHRGAGRDDRMPLRYLLQGSLDNANWRYLAVVPAGAWMLTAVKPVWEPDSAEPAANMLKGNGDTRTAWRGQAQGGEWIVDLDLGSVIRLGKTILRPRGAGLDVRRYNLLVESVKGLYPGQNRATDGWTRIYSKEFDQPKTDEAAFKDVETRYLRIQITDAFRGRPEIGEFEIYPAVADGKLTPAADGKGATLDLPPTPCRYVRMLITECQSDAPAVAEFVVWAGENKIVPPQVNLRSLATNDILEISPGDAISVRYNDEVNIHPGEPKTLRKELRATYCDGKIGVIEHYFFDDAQGNRRQTDFQVYRLDAGERFVVQIADFDADVTDGIDTLPFTVETSSGAQLSLVATETGPFTGIFTKEVDTASAKDGDKLAIKPGDKITVSYVDKENTHPGDSCVRSAALLANAPTKGTIVIRETQPKAAKDAKAPAPAPAPAEADRVKLIGFDEPLVVEVRDPDRARNAGDTVAVHLRTTGGATADLTCSVGGGRARGPALTKALEEGLFVGEIRLALGDKTSPRTVVEALRLDLQESAAGAKKSAAVPVLNVSGQDMIYAVYEDAASPDGPPRTLRQDTARLVTNGVVGFFDDQYETLAKTAHVGETLYLKVVDPDADVSGERDTVNVLLESSTGDKLTVPLTETLSHSGIFTRAVPLEHSTQPDAQNDRFEADYDATLQATYLDARNTESAQPVARAASAKVVMGSDGAVMAFGKKYPTPEVAVETQFKIGESYYYLGRKHMKLADDEPKPEVKADLQKLAREELGTGQRILNDLVRAYPDNPRLDQAAYLLGNLAQEQQRYDEAIEIFKRITANWSQSPTAPDAQFHVGICCEKKGDFDAACDEYVRLAYKYPESLLVGDAMIRIGLHFFDDKKFPQAIAVFQRFIEKFPLHAGVEEVWFKMGLAQVMDEKFLAAAEHFQAFNDKYPDSKLKAAALYWAGDSYLKANEAQKAYQMFKRVVWDFPESKWAKWARGKLTAAVFEKME